MAQKNLSIKLSLNDKQFMSALRKASSSMKRFGKSMKRTGQNLTTSLTMPIIALGTASVKLATDFETSMTKISTLVGASAQDLKEYEKGIMELSNQVGVSAKDLADGLFFITSAGFEGAEALDALEVSAKASAMGMGEMASISNALTSIMTAYADEQMTASQAGDLLHETLKQGKFEAGQFMDKLGSVIPVAAASGVSMEELGAASATMSKLSGDAAGTLTAMRSLLMSLQKPSAQQEEILAKLGMTTADLSAMMGDSLMNTLKFLFDNLKDNNQELLTMFGSSKAVVGALSTMGLQAETYAEVLDGMHNSIGNVNEGFETLTETSGFKFNKTLVSLQNTGIEIGNILLPKVLELAESFRSLLKRFQDLDPEAKKTKVNMALITAAAGPLLIILGQLLISIGAITKAVRLLSLAIARNPLGLFLTILASAGTALIAFGAPSREFNTYQKDMKDSIDGTNQQLSTQEKLVNELNDATKTAADRDKEKIDKVKQSVKNLKNENKNWQFLIDSYIDIEGPQSEYIKSIEKQISKNNEQIKALETAKKKFIEFKKEIPEATSFMEEFNRQLEKEEVFKEIENNLDNFFKKVELPSIESLNLVEIEEEEELEDLGFDTAKIVKEFHDLKSITDEMNSSFDSFGNVLQGTFAQALQSSDGFFKSFVEGSKRAMSAILAQLAATAVLNALLGGTGIGKALGFKDIGGFGGISKLLKGLPFFAEGGLVTGPTFAVVGEGPGTSLSNPEVVAPLDKLRSMMQNNGGGQVEVFGTLRGQDILLSSDRAKNNRNRTRGY